MMSTNVHGDPDLDTRPSGMMRDTLGHWVKECPHCRYAAPEIADSAPDGVAAIVGSEAYQSIDRKFERHSWLLAELGHYSDAGWVSLQAAWMADDLADTVTAGYCRGRAVELWQKGKRIGQNFMDSTEQEFALVVDVLRRRGDFAEARETCLEALNDDKLTPLIEDVLRFQLTLISRNDDSCHRMSEIPKPPEGAERVRLT
jgi:hypothetical protein